MLEELGSVVIVTNPAEEVDAIYDFCQAVKQPCVFLSFTPPHKTVRGLRCKTIPVFAWEFADIPDEPWSGQPRQNWANYLSQTGIVITHSNFAAQAVKKSLGDGFAAHVLPSPIWENYLQFDVRNKPRELSIQGKITDSYDVHPPEDDDYKEPENVQANVSIELDLFDLLNTSSEEMDSTDKKITQIELPAVVFTSVFNPDDGRKNWDEMIRTFCSAFHDVDDVCLLLKFVGNRSGMAEVRLLEVLYKCMPMKCRVIALYDYLDGETYRQLLAATHYTVNTSSGEGQCLPLMEFMSAGIPAVTPFHTAMADYADEHCAFEVASVTQLTYWPHDPRRKFRTYRYCIDELSLVNAYKSAFKLVNEDEAKYWQMSENAKLNLKAFCSRELIRARFEKLLQDVV